MAEHFDRPYAQEGPYEHGVWLSDEHYAAALKRMVKYCHDVILIDKEDRFLLPKRAAHKTPPWRWLVGGQVAPFMSLRESLQKTLTREIGLTLPAERLIHLGQCRVWFNGKDEGGIMHDTLSEVFYIHLSDEEIGAIILDPEEYDVHSLHPHAVEDIETIEPVLLRDVLRDMWGRYEATRRTA